MHFGAFQWDFRGAGFTRQLPNLAASFEDVPAITTYVAFHGFE
jgi:hypothetical protein